MPPITSYSVSTAHTASLEWCCFPPVCFNPFFIAPTSPFLCCAFAFCFAGYPAPCRKCASAFRRAFYAPQQSRTASAPVVCLFFGNENRRYQGFASISPVLLIFAALPGGLFRCIPAGTHWTPARNRDVLPIKVRNGLIRTALPACPDTRNDPWKLLPLCRTALLHVRGTHAADGCNASRFR